MQLGFGWSNGVIMDLLYMYGDVLYSENDQVEPPPKDSVYIEAAAPSSTLSQISTLLVALLVSATTGYIG